MPGRVNSPPTQSRKSPRPSIPQPPKDRAIQDSLTPRLDSRLKQGRYTQAMKSKPLSRRRFISFAAVSSFLVPSLRLAAQNKAAPDRAAPDKQSGFPAGYDAVEKAPQSHKLLFENRFIRVLQVQVAPGMKEPTHH